MKRRRLGQHYLVDPSVPEEMVRLAEIGPDDTVLEIGTGRGVLTEKLARACRRLEAYEVDPESFEETKRAVKLPSLNLHMADAFAQRPRFDVLVSSVPYSRSSDFVEWLAKMKYRRAVALLQEDFARKVVAEPGDRSYRAVSAIGQISAEISIGRRVGSAAFSPQPRVSSVIVVFTPRRLLKAKQIAAIRKVFSLRRRTVGSALPKLGFTVRPADRGRRVYQLSPSEVYDLVLRRGDE